jgi:hypothetical protein
MAHVSAGTEACPTFLYLNLKILLDNAKTLMLYNSSTLIIYNN